MRIAFVHCFTESIGIEYLSAFLKKEGHEVSLFFDPQLFDNYLIKNKVMDAVFSYRSALIDSVVKFNPDIVAFSAFLDNYIWSCGIAREIKRRIKTTIVFGGLHPTAVPYRVLKNDFIDFVIIGEGEEAMAELASCLAAGKEISGIQNLAYRNNSQVIVNNPRPPLKDLDALPFPDKDLFFRQYRNFINDGYIISFSRGCLNRCSYCNWNLIEKMYGKYYRLRSPGNVIKELVWAKQRYAIKRVEFMDSVFTYDKKWLEEFLPDYKKKVGIPFFCYIYPSSLIDKKLIDMLEDAGCTTIGLGVQTINPKLRKEVYLRAETNEDIARCASLITRTRIGLILGFILFPTQTEQEVINTLEFCHENNPDFAVARWLMFFPGTEVINISRKLSILNDDDIDEIEEGRDKFPYFKKEYPIKDISKIANLFLFSGVMPTFMMKNIIKSKLYHCMPSVSLYLPSLMIVGLLKKKFRNESFLSAFYYINYYINYMVKKLLNSHYEKI
jgi:anaerobic magnesium-protoporphyrin IX monomethyl ester cyclase